MANTYIAINRGLDGFNLSDFVVGTATTAAADIELRIASVDGQGNVLTRMDVTKALMAFERAIAEGSFVTTAPPL